MKVIGSIGLGAMGGAYAKFLLEDNYKVYGIDPDENNAKMFISYGGELLSNISDLVYKSDVIILSLPTVPIFKTVIDEIEKNGGVIECIESGYLQKEISDASSDYQIKIDNKERIVVGMTEFIKENEEIEIPILEIRKEVEEEQNKRLNAIKSNRNNQDVEASLLKIQECCKSGENLMPSIIKAVESYATLGEIVDSMKEVFGEWQEKVFF